ncbi:SMP-30/gluconolactonase/LRE family protein [Nocardioides sp. MAH-18]|uniref:SMP-30/gluconolactonase/LRE family protein n=1 Tax=Nocardioides agri TaxID=2682843 RepID=A0A6L6XUS6_9ACTN|nr:MULTISPECIES: SMP-30/gluconolactonase/LRE family protein [unclassified Nocardioides]MBA2955672.1 SMP-30/gluconolactonase/LRE family protein [Nocardioides sp. CGMCC 1.13656]MVQ50522.1 SMP-30/gluconolactonase/LRE family protein [Nocardioides sp. MAH-18]
MTTAEQVTDPVFELAEGPLWDAARERLVWVDILGRAVHTGRLDQGSVEIGPSHHFESYVGAAAVAEDGALLVAEGHHLTRVAPDGTRTSGPDLFADHPDDRWNDGTCDARGRILVGTSSLAGARHSQRLLRVDGDITEVLDDDLGLSNGLAFSPDDALLYSVDSVPARRVWVRDYDQSSGAVGPRRPALDLTDALPDGLCVDASGNLWLAAWGRGQVRCYSTAGELLDLIELPAPHTTSVAFVGPGLDQLLITTARGELSPAEQDEHPLSGSLFLARPGCTGLPPHAWSGQLSTRETP